MSIRSSETELILEPDRAQTRMDDDSIFNYIWSHVSSQIAPVFLHEIRHLFLLTFSLPMQLNTIQKPREGWRRGLLDERQAPSYHLTSLMLPNQRQILLCNPRRYGSILKDDAAFASLASGTWLFICMWWISRWVKFYLKIVTPCPCPTVHQTVVSVLHRVGHCSSYV